MSKEVVWPSIRSTVEDKGIIDTIKKADGRLKNIDSKDLMLIAASIAVKNKLPYDSGLESKMSDTISYANLNNPSYREYRHYISAIYYLTKAKEKVENMKDVADMVKNFEDYAHRGIIYLKDVYLDSKEGDNMIFLDFIDQLSTVVSGSKNK